MVVVVGGEGLLLSVRLCRLSETPGRPLCERFLERGWALGLIFPPMLLTYNYPVKFTKMPYMNFVLKNVK